MEGGRCLHGRGGVSTRKGGGGNPHDREGGMFVSYIHTQKGREGSTREGGRWSTREGGGVIVRERGMFTRTCLFCTSQGKVLHERGSSKEKQGGGVTYTKKERRDVSLQKGVTQGRTVAQAADGRTKTLRTPYTPFQPLTYPCAPPLSRYICLP